MITYNSDDALTFTVPVQSGCTLPTLSEVQSYSFGGYGSGISAIGIQQSAKKSLAIFVKTSSNTWGVLLGNEFQPQIYRGQNKDFPMFSSSYARLSNDFSRMIAQIQREEFREFFVKTAYYKRCREFSVLDCKYDFDFEAIFQHYGFASLYIDITKDLLTALFFAYTYTKDGHYYPCENFDEYNPTLYVSFIFPLEKKSRKTVVPISFQTLGRPLKQMAMALDAKEIDYKPYFAKYSLPKDPYIAIDVYEKFSGGDALFPKEPVADTAKMILISKELNSKLVRRICSENNVDADAFEAELLANNYNVSEIEWSVTDDMNVYMNDEIDRLWLPLLDSISLRRTSPIVRSAGCN